MGPILRRLEEVHIDSIQLPFWGFIAYRDTKVRLTDWAREMIFWLTSHDIEIVLECTDIPKTIQFLTKRNLADSFSGFVKREFEGYGTSDSKIPDALIECDSHGCFTLRTRRQSTAV